MNTFLTKYLIPNNERKYVIGFEEMHRAIKYPMNYCIIHTMPGNEQECLIQTTVRAEEEERRIESLLETGNKGHIKVVIYGRNSTDSSPEKKYRQLIGLGISAEVYVYLGGLFEWLLLQDVYGTEEFPTNGKCGDLLKFKPGFREDF